MHAIQQNIEILTDLSRRFSHGTKKYKVQKAIQTARSYNVQVTPTMTAMISFPPLYVMVNATLWLILPICLWDYVIFWWPRIVFFTFVLPGIETAACDSHYCLCLWRRYWGNDVSSGRRRFLQVDSPWRQSSEPQGPEKKNESKSERGNILITFGSP